MIGNVVKLFAERLRVWIGCERSIRVISISASALPDKSSVPFTGLCNDAVVELSEDPSAVDDAV